MSEKRASIFDLGAVVPDAPAPAPVARAKPANDVVKSTLYLPTPAHDVLRDIAHTERLKLHDLFMEGINHVLKTRGYATVAELKKAV